MASFEELYTRAMEAAGHKGGRAAHKKAENEVLGSSFDLKAALDQIASGDARARRPHGTELFYSDTDGAPGYPVEISLMTDRRGVGEAKFSAYIQRGPGGWRGYWHAYIPYGKGPVNTKLKAHSEGEIAGGREKVIKGIAAAYKKLLGNYGSELGNFIEKADRT